MLHLYVILFYNCIIKPYSSNSYITWHCWNSFDYGNGCRCKCFNFERIKEEFNSGRNILDAIEAGFQRAISTIVDANLTTLFAALALFSFGSGPIKDFQ